MKKLKWVTFVVFMVLAAPVHAAADVTNIDTGAGSENTTSNFTQEIVTVTNSNKVSVQNEVEAVADTGGNDASFNTGPEIENEEGESTEGFGGGQIETGSASFDVEIKNIVNTNRVSLALEESIDEEEGGRGGGVDEEEGGRGGGGEAELIATPVEILPSTGADPFAQLGMLFLLPLAVIGGAKMLKTKLA